MNLFKDIPAGDNPPEEINVVVEIPKGSSNKYEYDGEKGYFVLDRVLYSPLFYPLNYGLLPQTSSKDGDSLDVLVLTTFPIFSGCKVKTRPVAVFLMEDEEGIDPKIIAVPKEKVDPRFKEIQDVKDLPEHLKKEVQEFFTVMKNLEPGKFVKAKGWEGKEKAKEIIQEAIERYKDESGNK